MRLQRREELNVMKKFYNNTFAFSYRKQAFVFVRFNTVMSMVVVVCWGQNSW